MEQELSITQQDVDNCMKFGALLRDKIEWTVDTKEMMQAFQLLMWYNRLHQKLEANIMEFSSATKVEPKKEIVKEEKPASKKGK